MYVGAFEHTLTEFTIEPDFCTIKYKCQSVTRSDGYTNNISCDEITAVGEAYGGSGDLNILT